MVAWQLSSPLSRVKLQEQPRVPFTDAIFVPESSAVHSSAAGQSSPASAGAVLDESGCFLLLFLISLGVVAFLKRNPNTITALLFIVGIYHKRILNLAVKMITRALSSR